MYERENGSKRIIKALYDRKENESVIKSIAYALDYLPEQLKEDIQALYDIDADKTTESTKY